MIYRLQMSDRLSADRDLAVEKRPFPLPPALIYYDRIDRSTGFRAGVPRARTDGDNGPEVVYRIIRSSQLVAAGRIADVRSEAIRVRARRNADKRIIVCEKRLTRLAIQRSHSDI